MTQRTACGDNSFLVMSCNALHRREIRISFTCNSEVLLLCRSTGGNFKMNSLEVLPAICNAIGLHNETFLKCFRKGL